MQKIWRKRGTVRKISTVLPTFWFYNCLRTMNRLQKQSRKTLKFRTCFTDRVPKKRGQEGNERGRLFGVITDPSPSQQNRSRHKAKTQTSTLCGRHVALSTLRNRRGSAQVRIKVLSAPGLPFLTAFIITVTF